MNFILFGERLALFCCDWLQTVVLKSPQRSCVLADQISLQEIYNDKKIESQKELIMTSQY
jgi:hypothetical protein